MTKAALLVVVLTLLSGAAAADCEILSSDERECYDNSNAPPAMVYKHFIFLIFIDGLDYLGELERLKDEEHHPGRYIVEAGITSNMSSADVVRYFMEKFLLIEKEVHETRRRMLCVDDRPRYKGAENFLIFNQMEEVSLNIYEKHYYLARADLQASGLFDLDEALEQYPLSFTEVFTDHEKARDGSVERIYEDAAALCRKPWEHRFSVPVSESD